MSPRGIVLFFSLVSSILVAQAPFPIAFASVEKQIDGNPGDWNLSTCPWVRFENPILADPLFDNTLRAKFEWDELNFYGFVEIRDAQLIKLRYGKDNPTLYLGDALEIYLDPLNDSKKRMDVNDYQFIMDAGHEWAIFKGDRHLADSMWITPKEIGTATVAFQFQTSHLGTLNQEADQDSLWRVEFAIPWAALGKTAQRDSLFRLDVCLNDMDSIVDLGPIPEGVEIPCFSYVSWDGSRDFGFPDRWRLCRLDGGPGLELQLERRFAHWWLPLLAFLASLFVGIVFYLQRKINRLRNVPIRAEMGQTTFANILQPELPKTKSTQSTALFDKLREYVLAHLQDDLSPEDLARHAPLSLRQLQRIFREELDTSPSTFILLIKMEKAAAMLRSGTANVSEVAYALGFSDPGYFSKVFRKYFGQSPKTFV